MPSHEKGLTNSGIRTIANNLCKSNIINGTTFLLRSTTVSSNHGGGSENRRTDTEEFNSLTIQRIDIVKDSVILLLDDITTMGVSLQAGADKLKKAGAKNIISLALGKTVLESMR